jgi:hypothetical protein
LPWWIDEHPGDVMRAILRVTEGPYDGKCIWLRDNQSLRFGRAPQADQAFPDDVQMSGLHFEIVCDNAKCRVRDLRSTNGTFVNGARIADQPLADGDVLTAGRSTFRVEIDLRPRTEIKLARPSPALAGGAAASPDVPPADLPAAAPPPFLPPPVAVADAHSPVVRSTADESPLASRLPPSMRWLQNQLTEWNQHFLSGLSDPDPDVRREAACAAAWTRQPWLLEYCRQAVDDSQNDDPATRYLLAVLGKPVDLEQIQRLGRRAELGAGRLRLFGSYGHPAVIPDLINAMSHPDPKTCVAAGQAFTKVTGFDIASERTVLVGSDEPQENEGEGGQELVLPDADAARRMWRDASSRFMESARWCRGRPATERIEASLWEELDAVSRWEICLREHYEGRHRWAPDRVTRFPDLHSHVARK